MKIELNIKKSAFSEKFFPLLTDYSHRYEIYMGSAGSGKSYFITQKLVVRAISEKIRIMVCRRYATTIRNTVFSLFKEVLAKWGLTQYVKIRETDFTITFPNGSEIIFVGLDSETKLLSLNNIGCIFIEEIYEITRDIYEQLIFRLRGNSVEHQQIIAAFNPISKNHWLYEYCEVNPPKDSFLFIRSTYKDNPFLQADYIRSLEDMLVRNPQKARIYVLGEWGVPNEGLVIKNWRSEAFDFQALAAAGLEHRAGMDLGFIDPTAIIDSLYDRANKIIYVFNEYYKSGVQISDVAAAVVDMQLTKTKLYVDSAEPRSIQNLKNEGINAIPCVKGKDSVKAGLMFLQDHLIIVHPNCTNFITELENFSYIKSKQTGEWTEDTTHEWSHAIDACRYAYSDIYTNKKLKTISKTALSL